MVRICIRFFAGAAQACQCSKKIISCSPPLTLLDAALEACEKSVDKKKVLALLSHCSFLCQRTYYNSSTPLEEILQLEKNNKASNKIPVDDVRKTSNSEQILLTCDVLPPFAGG